MSEPGWAHHCGDLWRGHVLAANGRDICDIIGPMPRRPAEWAGMMRRLGVRSMSGVVSTVHGPPSSPLMARRGDIVRCGWALGICRGEDAEFYGGVMMPLAAVVEAWRIEAGGRPWARF